MAIGPIDFMDIFNATVEKFEAQIDASLKAHKMKPYDYSIQILAPKGMTSTHFEILKKRYERAGWREVHSYRNKVITFYLV